MSTSVSEAIILAGGLGTRLRTAVPSLPKCMAPIAKRPFIDYVIGYLQQQGIKRFVFSLGYMAELIEAHFRTAYPTIETTFVVEQSPLGTGGAIQLACGQVLSDQVAVVNGDTFFKADLHQLSQLHHAQQAVCTLALKPQHNTERFGSVCLDTTGRVTRFVEKKWQASSLINGGLYILDKAAFAQENLLAPCSFEKDYLEALYLQRKIYGLVQDSYFIDIGVPEDYIKAEKELNDE